MKKYLAAFCAGFTVTWLLAIVVVVYLTCCTASKQVYPTNTQTEKDCLAHYKAGDISWSGYQECLKNEKGP